MINRSLLSITILLIFAGCAREPLLENIESEIQKDPLFIDYMNFKTKISFNSSIDFPVAVGAVQREKQARKNGTLLSYYKSKKDVNGISWYDAVIVPRYERLYKFSKVYHKYVTRLKLPMEFIKDAERQYRSLHSAI